MGALGSALNGGKTVEPIDFRVLKQMLPESLPEMQRSNASGERTEMMGIQISSAEAQYQDSANGRVHVKISDLGTLTTLSGMAAALEPKSTRKPTRATRRRRVPTDGRSMNPTTAAPSRAS